MQNYRAIDSTTAQRASGEKEAAISGSAVDHRQWVSKSTKVMLC